MAVAPVKVALFCVGALAAATGVAYFAGMFDRGSTPQTAPMAAAPEAPAATPQPAPETPAAAASAENTESQPSQGEQPAAGTAPRLVVPSFDVVRVEPNGSMVVAGKAAPDAKVEIVNGATVIGTATAGQDGDFAIVLEDPLKPGDYQLVLRSSGSGSTATSSETAVVSVPDSADGQVLALVEQPGQPSRLITLPEAKDNAAGQPSAGDAQTPPAAGQTPATGDEQQATTEPSAPAAGQTGQQQAATEAPATAPAASQSAPAAVKLAVEAVEIEGKSVFVAGTAEPGRRVRAYANEILLGEAIASQAGRFLIEAERDLPVGDYIVRVDALAPDGVKVIARAAVPFEREAGEAVSAVAPPASAAGASTQDATANPAIAPETSGQQAPATASANPEELAPKLQNVDGSVIIRRGDTLWRISRRVYGLGVRYSTIYLANQEQIRNPDRIWPGQVFKLPGETDKGEKADLKVLGEQTGSTQ
ncbi:Ig-like domain-containing protein [Mesorhizobium sp. SB112]|uniref:Ig-like domain-containing protein n=1 Tax=Mesorhizobium sp. SB112 TaxID=3151853 RepID=UPI0032638D88